MTFLVEGLCERFEITELSVHFSTQIYIYTRISKVHILSNLAALHSLKCADVYKYELLSGALLST